MILKILREDRVLKTRQFTLAGKIDTGGHENHVPGLKALVEQIALWTEVSRVWLGSPPQEINSELVDEGHVLMFEAFRAVTVGGHGVAVTCRASCGKFTQIVRLHAQNLPNLQARLQAAGFGANW